MKLTRLQIYILAWSLYLAFIFSLFPYLKITVMLFSIPLAVLGGWLYLYRGALLTTLATIGVHFVLLSVYSDDPAVINETYNPFGIGSQLIFSCSAALRKTLQVKYNRLNNSLEEIVAERTKDLEQLTAYLISARQVESHELNAYLLEKPYNELKAMLSSSQLLQKTLSTQHHPREQDAENICMIISECIKQLSAMDEYSINRFPVSNNITDSIKNLIQQMEEVSEVKFQCLEHPEWNNIPASMITPLCDIIFEAVTNAMRHADAMHIHIGINNDQGTTTIYIENDGKPLTKGFKEGMGVPLMRYRAGKIGAKLSISPTAANLTRVTCSIPPKP